MLPAPIPESPAPVGSHLASRGPWGPWLTLVLGAAIFLAYSTAQGLALTPILAIYAMGGTPPQHLPALVMQGFTLSWAFVLSLPMMLFACAAAVLARRGPSLADYLALKPIPARALAGWILLMGVTVLALSSANDHLGRPAPEFVQAFYQSAGYLPLCWAAVGVCAPLAEELLFRGFLFAGLAASKLGQAGAVAVTSAMFMGLHLGQYDWVDLSQVGLVGVLMGWARARSGSLLPPLAMHVTLNLLALALYHFSELPERGEPV